MRLVEKWQDLGQFTDSPNTTSVKVVLVEGYKWLKRQICGSRSAGKEIQSKVSDQLTFYKVNGKMMGSNQFYDSRNGT